MARRRGVVYGEIKTDIAGKPLAGISGALPELITQGFGDWGEPTSIILDGFTVIAGEFPELISQGFGSWGSRGSVICDGLFHQGAPVVPGTGISAPLIQGAELFEDASQGLFF